MNGRPLIFPRHFSEGDAIGLAAPASPPDEPNVIEHAIERFIAHGFRVKTGKHLWRRESYLAGTDSERAEDINTLFADSEVKAIFALRGGYGSCRILPLLDYEMIRANPKPFTGYSDITAMHLAILAKSGVITFHGSNGSSAFTPPNDVACHQMLMQPHPCDASTLLFSRGGACSEAVKTLVPGRVSGTLLGGNLTCLLRLIGTPFAPDFREAILFLEDTEEKAYRVDGMFTHLRLAGVLDQIGGLVLGQFDHHDVDEQARIAACLVRETTRIGVPAISGAPIGHFAEQIIVPQGVPAELDADNGTLSFRPPALG